VNYLGKKKYCVVSQDEALREKLKKPPHVVPTLYFGKNQINFEPPSQADKKKTKEV